MAPNDFSSQHDGRRKTLWNKWKELKSWNRLEAKMIAALHHLFFVIKFWPFQIKLACDFSNILCYKASDCCLNKIVMIPYKVISLNFFILIWWLYRKDLLAFNWMKGVAELHGEKCPYRWSTANIIPTFNHNHCSPIARLSTCMVLITSCNIFWFIYQETASIHHNHSSYKSMQW